MIGVPQWMTLGPDPRDDADLPPGARAVCSKVRRAGFGCQYAGTDVGGLEVYLVRDRRRGGSITLHSASGRLELWSPRDPNGAPAGNTRFEPSRADAADEVTKLLVATWGRPPDARAAVRLRSATPYDATSVAQVHVRSWQHAYRGLLPDVVLAPLDVAARAKTWRKDLRRPGAGRPRTTVAEDGFGVIGFVTTCPSRDGDADPAEVGELAAVYLDPDSMGIGVGRRLVSDAVDRLRDAGWTSATLWVLDVNDRAVGFFEKLGWTADGTSRVTAIQRAEVTELRLRRSLG